MDKGSFYKVDRKYKFNNVQALMKHVESQYGVSMTKQILLISGGRVLDKNCTVEQYDAGDSQSNPIYVFNRDSSIPNYHIQPDTYAIQDDDVEPRINQLLQLRPSHATIRERAKFVSQLNTLFHDLQDGINTLISDQHAMVQGWCVALANMEELVKNFRVMFGRMKHVTQHIQQHEALWVDCFERLPKVRQVMERIPLLETLLSDTEMTPDNVAETHSNDKTSDEQKEDNRFRLSLYQWTMDRSQPRNSATNVATNRAGEEVVPLLPSLSQPQAPSTVPSRGPRRVRCFSATGASNIVSPTQTSASGLLTSGSSFSPLTNLNETASQLLRLPVGLGSMQRNWFEESYQAFQYIQNAFPPRFCDRCEELLLLGTDPLRNPRLDTDPLGERLQNLSPISDKAVFHVSKVDTICDVMQHNLQHIDIPECSNRSSGMGTASGATSPIPGVSATPTFSGNHFNSPIPLTVVQDMCTNHVNLLREACDHYKELLKMVDQCNLSKCQLAELIGENQKWITIYQQDVHRYITRIKQFDGYCKVLDRFSVVVQQMESAPRLYARCLREIVRRREMFECIDRWAQQVLGFNSDLENQQRATLALELKSHFLHSIFNQMSYFDRSHYGLVKDMNADKNLPVVTRADLLWITSLVPELTEDLWLPVNASVDNGAYDKEILSMVVGPEWMMRRASCNTEDPFENKSREPSFSETTDYHNTSHVSSSCCEASCQTCYDEHWKQKMTAESSTSTERFIEQQINNSLSALPSGVVTYSSVTDRENEMDSSVASGVIEQAKIGDEEHHSSVYSSTGLEQGLWTPLSGSTFLTTNQSPKASEISATISTDVIPVVCIPSSNSSGPINMAESYHTTQEDISPSNSTRHRELQDLLSQKFKAREVLSTETQTVGPSSVFSKTDLYGLQEKVQHLQVLQQQLYTTTQASSDDYFRQCDRLKDSIDEWLHLSNSKLFGELVDEAVQFPLSQVATTSTSSEVQFSTDITVQTECEWQTLFNKTRELDIAIEKLKEENENLKREREKVEEDIANLTNTKSSDIVNLRSQHANVVAQLKRSLEQSREEALIEQNRALKNQWMEEKHELIKSFNMKIHEKTLESQGVIDSLFVENTKLSRQVIALASQQMKDRELIRRMKAEPTTPSSSPSGRGDTDNLSLERSVSSPSSSPMLTSVYRDLVDTAYSGAIGTVLSSSVMDASMNMNSLARLTLHGRVMKFVHHQFKNGDVVAFVPIVCSAREQWRMLSTDGELYFLHDSCFDILTQSVSYFAFSSSPTVPFAPSSSAIISETSRTDTQTDSVSSSCSSSLSNRRDYLRLAVFDGMEKCTSKKAKNRFDLPLGCVFYRVKVRLRTPMDTAKA